MPYPWKQSSITKKLKFLGQLCNLPCSYMAKRVFNIRLTHFQHLDNQRLGFIPDINRILTKYTLHHVFDRYLSDGVFPSKYAWKRIIYEKTIQRSNSELFHECVENYPTCVPLILRSDGVSCIWTMTRHCQELSSICRRTKSYGKQSLNYKVTYSAFNRLRCSDLLTQCTYNYYLYVGEPLGPTMIHFRT